MAGYLAGSKTTAEWKSTLGALSVGMVSDEWTDTRQITGVAAGTKDTDAVNVAQLKAVESKITQTGAEAQKHASVTGETNISVVQDGTNNEGGKNYKVSLAENIDLGQNGSIKVGKTTINNDGLTVQGGPSVTTKGIDAGSKKITKVVAGTADTDAVNVSQLKKEIAAAKTTIEEGDNIKVEAGSAKGSYKISATDTYTTGGTYDAETKKLKFTQNDPSKNYEVDVSAMINNVVDTNTTYTLEGKEDKEKNTTTISLTDSNGKKQQVTVATKDTRNTIVDSDTVTVEAKAQEDGSNEYTLNVKTDGKVEKDNKGIVTGGTVYKETRIEKDGNYIKKNNTAGENLIALDKQVGINTGNIHKNTETINILGKQVGNLDTKVNRVGAGAAALAGLHPLDYDPDNKFDFVAGYGNYKGAHALAIGAFYRPDENKMISIGGSFGGGENMVSAGVSVKLGQGTGISTSKVAMATEISELKEENREMKQEIEVLKEQMQKLLAGK